jgi:hypothetical protein
MEGLERVCLVSSDTVCMAFEEPINPIKTHPLFRECPPKPRLTDLVNMSLDTHFLKWPSLRGDLKSKFQDNFFLFRK